MADPVDILVVGAGPTGLALALYARARGLSSQIVDRAVVGNLGQFPIAMRFFTSKATMELGAIPFDSPSLLPSREEALGYYGRVARLARLPIELGCTLENLTGSDGNFVAQVRGASGEVKHFAARKVVLATGVFGRPRTIDVPGASLSKVVYGYQDPFHYAGRDVLIVGAGNGSAEAAHRIYHAGGRVTVLNRRSELRPVKWRWHVRDMQELVAAGAVRLLCSAELTRVDERSVTVGTPSGSETFANDDVLILVGFEPDTSLFDRIGIRYDETSMPELEPRSLETSVRGVYVAGIAAAGSSPERVLIWGARHHGKAIVRHVLGEESPVAAMDIRTVPYWRQFNRLTDEPDRELLLDLVPVLAGELRDDIVDIFEYRRSQVQADFEPTKMRALGHLLDELEGWLVRAAPDGSAEFKGTSLNAEDAALVRLCDGTRRLRELAQTLADQSSRSLSEAEDHVLALVLPLLRQGRLFWRPRMLVRRSGSDQ